MSELLDEARAQLVVRDRSPTWWLTANIWMLLLMGWIFIVPIGRHHILMPLLALSAAAGALRMLAADWEQIEVRSLMLFMAVAGATPALVGLFESTPGLVDVAVPLVGGPIAWFAISGLAGRWFAHRLPMYAAIATIVLTVWLVLLVLGIGRSFLQTLDPTAYGTLQGGASRANYIGSTTLIATVPMLATVLYDRFRSGVPVRRAALLTLGLVGGMFGALVSGRQAVIGAVALIPLILGMIHLLGFRADRIATRAWTRRDGAIGGLALAVAAGAAWILGLRPRRLAGDFLDALGIGGEAESSRIGFSADVRSRQSASLLDGFRENLWVGRGAGAVSPEFHTWRGFELGSEFTQPPRPWRAELSYHLLLFEGGLLALAAYAIAAAVAIFALRQVYRTLGASDKTLLRASIAASLAMAIATAADPLVRSVGQQWPIYLPAIIAGALIGRNRLEPGHHRAGDILGTPRVVEPVGVAMPLEPAQ